MKTPFRWLLLTVDMALALGPVIHAAIPQRWRERRCGSLVKDTTTMTGRPTPGHQYPATWARQHGKGRVFYTSMRHRAYIWTNPTFQAAQVGGLNWAPHRVDAEISPNLARAAPQAPMLCRPTSNRRRQNPPRAKSSAAAKTGLK